LLFDTFIITVWYKLYYCDDSLSIGVRIIFTTNELVDRVRNFKSNAFRFKKFFMEKCAADQIFNENFIKNLNLVFNENFAADKTQSQNLACGRFCD